MRAPQGIRSRHSRACRSIDGARCNCRPSWEAWVYSKRDGKKVRKTFPSLAAAKVWRNDALSALSRGRFRAPVPTTVREAAASWLDGAKAGTIRNRGGRRFKPSTLRGYERSLTLRVLPELGHNRLSDLRRLDVQDFADKLLADGLDPSTILNTLDPLRAIYRRALQREQVGVNPTIGLELAKPNGSRDRIASPQEALALLNALPDEDRTLWATALYAGLRRGELRGLRWSDVNLPSRELRVERSWDDVEGAIDGKSDAAERTVPIIGALAPELAAHKLRTARDADALVFGVTAELPFEPSTVRRRARAAWDGAGLEPIGLHECRHTFASMLIAAGVNAKAITEAMGHATITMTFDRYGHLMPGGRDEARERVDAYMSGRG
jgi:integrase